MEQDENLTFAHGVPMPPKEFEALLKAAPEVLITEAQPGVIEPCSVSKESD